LHFVTAGGALANTHRKKGHGTQDRGKAGRPANESLEAFNWRQNPQCACQARQRQDESA
jgi:hypothetical protein